MMPRLLRGLLAAGLAGSLLLGPAAEARDNDYSDRLETANAMLTRLETHDYADEAAQEFGQARLEVAEAQAKITGEDYARAEIVLNRLESRLMLAESILERATIEELADQRETEQFDMMTEADNIQVDLETAQQQRQVLQDEVSAIVDQMEAEQ